MSSFIESMRRSCLITRQLVGKFNFGGRIDWWTMVVSIGGIYLKRQTESRPTPGQTDGERSETDGNNRATIGPCTIVHVK